MGLEIDIRIKYNELLVQAFTVLAQVMVLLEMLLKTLVVHKVLMADAVAHTNVALLVFVAAVFEQLVVAIKVDTAKMTFWMALKTSIIVLVDSFVALLDMLL